MDKYKCAIFDLDGTIIDSTGVWAKIDVDFLGIRGISVPGDYINEIKVHTFESGAIYTIERFGLNEKPEDIVNEWREMAVKEYSEKIVLKENAKEYLKMLKRQGVKLSVATSSDRMLFEPCLRRNEIYDLFDAFTQTSEVSRGKGYPDVYEEAARRCGCTANKCVVFEDIIKGIEGAKKGGFYTVGVYDEASAADEDRIRKISDRFIMDYSELLGKL